MGSIQRSIAILTILLKKYRPLTYQDIQRELLSRYGEEIDWRTVKSHIDALSKMFDIIRRDAKGRVCVKAGLGGKTVQSVIKTSLLRRNEDIKMVA